MMLRLASGQFSPRSSVDGPRLSNSVSFSSLMIEGLSRKSVTYDRLPEEPIKLSVRKLDGTCFDIDVPKMATVADVKLAVEAAFCHMPKKGPGKISWSHVWGHFCLSFQDQKLVVDSEHIRNFHIKDGDQLEFIRHISSSSNITKKRSKKRDSDSLPTELDESLSPSNSSIDTEQEGNKLEDYDMENGSYGYYDNNDESIDDGQDESRFVKCWSVCVPKRKSKAFSARFDCGFLCSFRRLLLLCDGRQYTRAETLKDDTRLDVWRKD